METKRMSNIPTADQVLAQQRADHDMPPKPETPKPETNVPAVTNSEAAIDSFLTEFAGGGGATFFKFTKGRYVDRDGEEIAKKTEFVCPYEQIQIGWIRFNGKGNSPTRHMGPLFSGFVPPSRNSLGDNDPSAWEVGLNGEPADPWQMQCLLPLLDAKTGEPFVFQTVSVTGRGAVGKLILACKQLRKKKPDIYSVVRLDVGGYQHRDPRIGFVEVPAFPVIGQAPKDGTALPDTSLKNELDDAVPF